MTLVSLENEKFTSTEIRKALIMGYHRLTSKCEDGQQKREIIAYQTKKGKQNTSNKPDKLRKCFSCGNQGFAKQYQKKKVTSPQLINLLC